MKGICSTGAGAGVAGGLGFEALRASGDDAVADAGADVGVSVGDDAVADAGADVGVIVGDGASTFAVTGCNARSGVFCRKRRTAPATIPASSNPAPPMANGAFCLD